MSEFQYYEFQAVERPLNAAAQEELRGITSRGRITSRSLINEYHWGDFKGDPDELVRKYFDAFLYDANWGSRTLLLRVPRASVVPEQIEPYCNDGGVGVWYTPTHAFLDFRMHFDGSGSYLEFAGEDGSPMGSLLPLRQAVMSGDLRAMYVAWLASLDSEGSDHSDNDEEPPVPPGLNELSPELETLAGFLQLDQLLLAAAAAASPAWKPPAEDETKLKGWLASLSASEKDALLLRSIEDEAFCPGPLLRSQFRAHEAAGRKAPTADATPRRTIGALRAEQVRLHRERAAREAEEKRRRSEAEARQKVERRERHLASLVGREERLWKTVDDDVSTKQSRKYDAAIETLRDLFDLAKRDGSVAAARSRLAALCERHGKKVKFVQMVEQARLGAE